MYLNHVTIHTQGHLRRWLKDSSAMPERHVQTGIRTLTEFCTQYTNTSPWMKQTCKQLGLREL